MDPHTHTILTILFENVSDPFTALPCTSLIGGGNLVDTLLGLIVDDTLLGLID